MLIVEPFEQLVMSFGVHLLSRELLSPHRGRVVDQRGRFKDFLFLQPELGCVLGTELRRLVLSAVVGAGSFLEEVIIKERVALPFLVEELLVVKELAAGEEARKALTALELERALKQEHLLFLAVAHRLLPQRLRKESALEQRPVALVLRLRLRRPLERLLELLRRLYAHQVEQIDQQVLLDLEVQRTVYVQRGRQVHLQQPWLQLAVQHDVEPEHFEAVLLMRHVHVDTVLKQRLYRDQRLD